MTKKILVLSAALILSANLLAQVTIGSANAPKEGAILDLNNGAKGGLILSNVNINDPEVIPSGFAGMGGADIATAKAQLPGALVYNLNENTCTGILVWDGVRWKRLGLEENPPTGTQKVKIVSPDESIILGGDLVTFELESPPTDAKMYTWYASDDGGATYKYAVTTTANSFSKTFAAGNHLVKAVLDNCRSLEASLEKSFATKSVSPSFGHTGGGNTIYIYGNYPYAATSDYVQSGLVAHYDGVNNSGLGDKYHHNDINQPWANLADAATPLNVTGTATTAAWEPKGYRDDSGSSLRTPSIVPDTWPDGNEPRTAEIIYTTPPTELPADAEARLFWYGP
ncbi:MAG: hypothetical protein LBP72_08450, partial [Dysgonamonadaceae bacterium]|nr:hypothetical protein [Dysgonamonadaceae bacterium]